MKPRLIVILTYTITMLGLTWMNIHLDGKPSSPNGNHGITWSRFFEAPTCAKGIDDLHLNTPIMKLTQTRPARIEIDTLAECDKPYAGFVADFDGLYVLTLTSEPHLVGSFEYEMNLCLCPHRFVYEFGPEYIEENKTVFVKNGFVAGTLGEL